MTQTSKTSSHLWSKLSTLKALIFFVFFKTIISLVLPTTNKLPLLSRYPRSPISIWKVFDESYQASHYLWLIWSYVTNLPTVKAFCPYYANSFAFWVDSISLFRQFLQLHKVYLCLMFNLERFILLFSEYINLHFKVSRSRHDTNRVFLQIFIETFFLWFRFFKISVKFSFENRVSQNLKGVRNAAQPISVEP